MCTNKVATVVLFNVSQSMSSKTDNNETFFERSLNCLKKIITRKIFSQENDELGIVLFGTEETCNNLLRGSFYRNINTWLPVCTPTWEMFEQVEELSLSSLKQTNWIEALIVAMDFLRTETQGRRYKNKNIIMFSDFSNDCSVNEEAVEPIVNTLEGENFGLVVVGREVNSEGDEMEIDSQVTDSLRLMFNTVSRIDSAVYHDLTEIENDLKYYEKKQKLGRLTRIDLSIGADIKLPVRWMKVSNEETRFKWIQPEIPESQFKGVHNTTFSPSRTSKAFSTFTHNKMQFTTDMQKATNFGGSLVELSYADIEAMSRKTGPPSFTYIGSVKSNRISHATFISSDRYIVVPDTNARSIAMFSAFVDALIESDRYGLARRISVKNGKINVGALLPVSDDLGKAMYFLKLPYAEWVCPVPERRIPEPSDETLQEAIDHLIKTTMLPEDLVEEGKGILVRDPTFQSRCNALYLRAVGKLPEYSVIELPETVQKIMKPQPFSEETIKTLNRLAELYPYTELTSTSPRKNKTDANSTSTGGSSNKISDSASKNKPKNEPIVVVNESSRDKLRDLLVAAQTIEGLDTDMFED